MKSPSSQKENCVLKECGHNKSCAHEESSNNLHQHHPRKKTKIVVDIENKEATFTHNSDQQSQISFLDDPETLADSIFEEDVQLAVWRRPKLPNFIKTLSDPHLDSSNLPTFYGNVTPTTVADILRNKLLLTSSTPLPTTTIALKKDNETPQKSAPATRLSNTDIEELIHDVERLVKVFQSTIEGGPRGEEFSEADDEENENDNDDSDEGNVEEVHVKLECLTDNGCVFWHQDTVPLRMVTTYKGPCTEYIEDNGNPEISQFVLSHRQDDCSKYTKSLSNHDVALFKGRCFDDIEEGGEDGNIEEEEEEEEEDPEVVMLGSGIVHRSPRIEGTGITRLVLILDIPAEFHEEEEENSYSSTFSSAND